MDDHDDGLMLNFAPAAASAATSNKRPKQTAKARFAQKRTAQQSRRQAPKQNGLTESTAASAPARITAVPTPSTEPPAAKRQRIEAAPTPSSSAAFSAPRFDPRSALAKPTPVPSRASQVSAAASSAGRRAASSIPQQQRPSTAGAAASSSTSKTTSNGIVSTLFPAHGVLEDSNIAFTPFQRKAYDPTNAPSTTSDFASCGLDPLLVYHLASKMKIGSNPTSIQKAALPHLLHPGLDRDILIQAQTGSGKTLTYLLPIVQSLLPLCEESFIDRSVGTLAIILAPTRELARQIYEVLEKLVSLALSLKEQSEDSESAVRRTRWLVPGLLSGGSTKNHEKQRLRKGCPILVSTPGRLLDHLQNTSSFDVGKCRWLVLDEADRLLEMGFEEQLTGIVKALDGRRNLACGAARQAMPGYEDGVAPGDADWIQDAEVMDTLGVTWWSHPRRVVLCSATLDENVQVLAGKTLINPKIIRGIKDDSPEAAAASITDGSAETQKEPVKFAAPAQLTQSFITTPPKLRLVTLLSVLRAYITRARHDPTQAGSGRVIVFMSCTDSVDFHYAALGGARMNSSENDPTTTSTLDDDLLPPHTTSELIPGIPIFRLHGSMTQQERIASLKGFSGGKKVEGKGFEGSILLCTSVASRGLDLPDVGCVVQLDPPTEGGIEEYLHRVGRTARVGRAGESWLLVLPQEVGWVQTVLESNMIISGTLSNHDQKHKINPTSIEFILQQGMGGTTGTLEYQSRATEVQLAFERWVLSGDRPLTLARKAFLSHVRAYATHSAEEKVWFNVRALHLGHLAKAFALREAPRSLGAKSSSLATTSTKLSTSHEAKTTKRVPASDTSDDEDSSDDAASDYESTAKGDGFELDKSALAKLTQSIVDSADGSNRSKRLEKEVRRAEAAAKGEKQTEVEARMYAKVRALGKMSKKHGVLGAHGADEFQIA
ncbi:RNA helicase [Pseudozyma hubeiensis SY62]|uniref:ATP-dependent RNA helicase n=1 Tax=Pseudozyma hubeiensis (strain SY62) TaxID=1305764 RepID=R9P1R6_PSEHS|nr:RNA helicase [Pseudozyma hubeiensis SY62]GAC95102.1 RNA helicase [Pseudozyma hubeiensis SY62]